MVDTIPFERALPVVNAGRDDVERIDEINSEDGGDGGDFSSDENREGGYQEAREHGAGFSEKNFRGEVVVPCESGGWEHYRENREYENGILPELRSGIRQIEPHRRNADDEEGDDDESGGQSRNPVGPVD